MKIFAQSLLIAALASTAHAEEAVLPDAQEPGAPEVTILDMGKTQIEEYRASGRLYMIKVIPRKGPPYFLIDADGDGSFETRRNELAPNLLIPSWVIFSW